MAKVKQELFLGQALTLQAPAVFLGHSKTGKHCAKCK